MKKLIITILMLFTVTVDAGDWRQEDTYRELAWTAFLVVDYGQTMNIARNPERFKEYNPILGEHPSQSSVGLYMLSAAIIHPIISYYLPPKYRRIWQYISIGIEAGAVGNNFGAGIGINF